MQKRSLKAHGIFGPTSLTDPALPPAEGGQSKIVRQVNDKRLMRKYPLSDSEWSLVAANIRAKINEHQSLAFRLRQAYPDTHKIAKGAMKAEVALRDLRSALEEAALKEGLTQIRFYGG